VVNLGYVVGMAMRVHENCSGKYVSNINIGKGACGFKHRVASNSDLNLSENNDHHDKNVLVSTF
jgi:hypothetical protein